MSEKERRRAVRVPARLAMEVKLKGGGHARTESINVSANGVYFFSPRHIAPLTKLEITLIIPTEEAASKKKVSCEGVVVRTEPEQPREGLDRYEVACYFTSISAKAKDQLESYILKQLAF